MGVSGPIQTHIHFFFARSTELRLGGMCSYATIYLSRHSFSHSQTQKLAFTLAPKDNSSRAQRIALGVTPNPHLHAHMHSHSAPLNHIGYPFPISLILASQKDDAFTGIEPLTLSPRSSAVTTGPPWQV